MLKPSARLSRLSRDFQDFGHDIYFVGGCVRDSLYGHTPKDIDLTTEATPDEQIAIYKSLGIRYFETGLQHGTLTISLGGEVYEITTMRTESEHDGRHAKVAYTRDLREDLSRRDLTINAMAQTMDGDIIDPFGGKQDLADGIVRFVGDADERIKEDYLRILRYFRFAGRYGTFYDRDALMAITNNVKGLKQISGERIWSELKQMIPTHKFGDILNELIETGVAEAIGFPTIGLWAPSITSAQAKGVKNPVSILAYYAGTSIESFARMWKWSNEEKGRAKFIRDNLKGILVDERLLKKHLVAGTNKDWVMDIAKLNGYEYSFQWILDWDIPKFPVSGDDLIKMGYTEGLELGRKLQELKDAWELFDYKPTKKELLCGSH